MSDEPSYLGPDLITGMPTPYQWSRKEYDDRFKVSPPPVTVMTPSPPVFPNFTFRGPAPAEDNVAPAPAYTSQEEPESVLAGGSALAVLAAGAVLWRNTSGLMVGAVLVGVLVASVIGCAILWPATRIWSAGVKPGRIFQACFLSILAYLTTAYLLTHFDTWILSHAGQRLQNWIGTFDVVTWPTGDRSFVPVLLLTQLLALLMSAATISLRLGEAFGGIVGYIRACIVSLVILVALGGGTAFLVRAVLAHVNG